jgi:phage shock protein E
MPDKTRHLLVPVVGSLLASVALAGDPTLASTIATMTPVELLERQAQPARRPLFVLDVRTPQEYAEGHVPGAVNIPHDQLASRLAEVPRDQDVVLYCRSGRRAGLAADVLAAHGYRRLAHLEGDMQAWVEQKRPVARP